MDNDFQSKFDIAIQRYATANLNQPSKIPVHTHNGTDSVLITKIELPTGTPLYLGLGGAISTSSGVDATEQIQTSLISGKEKGTPIGTNSSNLQFNLLHQPQNALNQSFITAYRGPIYGNIIGTTVSTTLGGNTVTTSGYSFVVNSLAGALINIFDSSGTLIETQTIASNTSTIITITGTWLATTSSGTMFIFQPVYFGSADTPYQRFYTQEGTGGGVRFGVGPTAGGQNGLLYSDATGDLYWRDKAGTSTKLN